MKKILMMLVCCIAFAAYAQTDTTHTPLIIPDSTEARSEIPEEPLTISGYIEPYYSYATGNPANHTKPSFIYSFNRNNEVNLNLGFIKAAYSKEKVRGNLALSTGTYVNANYAAEPGVLKNIFEANAGFKLSKKKNLWVDGGVFASHIGFESAIGKDCWNLTRSMLADNSPYFESGAKVSYTSDNEKWFISGLYLNGWQRIERMNGNNTPAFGHQLTYKPTTKIVLNSSSFVGSDTPDSTREMRYFHNFYGIFQLHEKFGLTLGFDIGAQQKSKGSSSYNWWYSPVVIAKYSLNKKINLAARGEYYSDKNQVIIHTGSTDGFQTYGYSMNLDYIVSDNLLWRLEARGLHSKNRIYTLDDKPNTNYYFLTTSMAISF